MCVTEGTLTTLCQEHIDEKIADIIARYPFLDNWPRECHTSCATESVRDLHGHDAAAAHAELANLRWFNGGE